MIKTTSFIIAIIVVFTTASSSAQPTQTADAVMRKVAAKLASVKALGYTYTREFNYPSEDYLSKSVSTGYLELSAPESELGFRFFFSDDEYLAVYNGSENFIAVKKKKSLIVTNNPPANRMEGSASLYNSPLTLKYVLPRIIADNNIAKKLSTERVTGRLHYLLEFSLPKASISGLGDIRELRSDRTSIYRIRVDAKSLLPLEVLVTNDKNQDFMRTTFASITDKPKPPADESWYFSSYTSEYKLEQPEEKKLLPVGQAPPEFVLRELESGAQVSLERYKGKVVLLEFWIAQCGFCIAAVPKLNEIAKTFPDVELISINVHDPVKTIASFKARNKPVYTILTEGEATGDAYGVGGYPAIVLIGKDGKIAYASLGLFEKDLEAAIKASLQN